MRAPIPFPEPLYVSRPMLPPVEDFVADVRVMWDTHVLTNMGPYHQSLEFALQARVGTGRLSLWNNGTNALLGGLAALDLTGEVIVTPFTFPATVHAIASLGLTPVFADIDPVTMTISPESIRGVITPQTSGIVGTHIYGTFCDTVAIAEIAREHGLRVMYDGAHSFGRKAPVFPDGESSLGDVTMLSFHATKLFHAVEGGALIVADKDLDDRIRYSRNFGIRSEDSVPAVGLNGKMSELHAAMGIRVLQMLDEEIDRRHALGRIYEEMLGSVPGISIAAGLDESAQYLVLRIDKDSAMISRDELYNLLRPRNIICRKYFHPLCSTIPAYASHPSARHLPHAERAAQECLAMPYHGGLSEDDVRRICQTVLWARDEVLEGIRA
jgi:dTDP-4-amino-4,6-dideoxygalactose transaminase